MNPAATTTRAESTQTVVSQVTAWARAQPDILAVALIGSWARGNPTKRSDVDFMILSESPMHRIAAVRWTKRLCADALHRGMKACRSGIYGAVWSRHIMLRGGQKIELSFAPRAWASTVPLDAGTRRVVRDGLRILYDPQGVLAALVAVA